MHAWNNPHQPDAKMLTDESINETLSGFIQGIGGEAGFTKAKKDLKELLMGSSVDLDNQEFADIINDDLAVVELLMYLDNITNNGAVNGENT